MNARLNAAQALSGDIGAGSVVVNDYQIQADAIDGGHRLTITRGSEVQTIDLMDGVGIANIVKTGSTGDVDSYRITFTDGSTFDYTVETNAAAYAAAELERVAAENGRKAAETSRTDAELARESAETARESAESARAQAEDGRQSAEAARVTDEQNRASAESGRVAAENARVAAETARANAENERAGAETLRAAAETERANAESGRVSAEQGRVSAESERVAAEEARATEFAGFSGEINGLKDDFNACFDGGKIIEKFAEANQIKAPSSSESTIEYGDDGSCSINANGYNTYYGWMFNTIPDEEYDVILDASKAFFEMFIVDGSNPNSSHLAEITPQDSVYSGKFTAQSNVSTVFVYATYDSGTTVIESLDMVHTVPIVLRSNAINTSDAPADGDIRPITSDAMSKALSAVAYIKNIMPVGVICKHGYINHNNGDFVSRSDDMGYVGISDYIAVSAGAQLSISAKYGKTGGRSGLNLQVIAFYDADKSFISSLGEYNAAATTVQTDDHRYVDIPDNAAYIRFNFFTSYTYYDGVFTDFQAEYGDHWTDYSSPQEFVPKIASSHWQGKKWVAIGDSITARPGNYVNTVASGLGLTATNAGISGAGARTMRECFSDPESSDYHQEWHDAIAEADLVTIYGCINNFGINAEPIGDLYDSAEGTFIYQFKQLIDAVFTVNQNCRLVIIGTHNAWDEGDGYLPGVYQPCGSGTDTVAEYVDAVGRVARYYGCPFIDMYNLSGFNQYNGATYLADSLHPNDRGYDRIAKILIEEINRVQD